MTAGGGGHSAGGGGEVTAVRLKDGEAETDAETEVAKREGEDASVGGKGCSALYTEGMHPPISEWSQLGSHGQVSCSCSRTARPRNGHTHVADTKPG